jgi:DNA-binding beta-propeller fold protein YncE
MRNHSRLKSSISGGTDYVAVEAATGRVFVSRGTHMMVVEGATGKVLGDIPNTPGVHGAGMATKAGHGFTTNGGDQTVTMFDLETLEVVKQIKVGPGQVNSLIERKERLRAAKRSPCWSNSPARSPRAGARSYKTFRRS